jgi:very-short-patch-repair endonuclease
VAGAVELLEIEPSEVAFFYHPSRQGGGVEIFFYETTPGGTGHLRRLAEQFPGWAEVAMSRLYDHDCTRACYRCLKSYRNQPFHKQLDKTLIHDALFQFACGELVSAVSPGSRSDGLKLSGQWIAEERAVPTEGTVIEKRLFDAIRAKGRLPDPTPQREFRSDGTLVTVADFAYEDVKIAVYCDGFAYHAEKDKLASDAQKRNFVQSQGWAVLTFWGKTILKNPERCEEQIWRVYAARRPEQE